MAVREFDGIDDYIQLSAGAIGALNSARATTVVLVVRPASLATTECFLSIATAGDVGLLALYDGGSGLLDWGSDDPSTDDGANINMDTTWQVIALTKGSGSATPRFHRKQIGSGVWTHSNASGAIGSQAGGASSSYLRLGRFNGAATGYKDMRLALVAVWGNSALSDGDVESIETNASTAFVQGLSPSALVELNQASAGTALTDLMGGGANQTLIVGTTVITGDDPAWTFIPPPAPQFRFDESDHPKLGRRLLAAA